MTLFQEKYRIESARFKDWDYSSRGWYFVTICANNRQPIFGGIADNQVRLSSVGLIADAELKTLSTHYQKVELSSTS